MKNLMEMTGSIHKRGFNRLQWRDTTHSRLRLGNMDHGLRIAQEEMRRRLRIRKVAAGRLRGSRLELFAPSSRCPANWQGLDFIGINFYISARSHKFPLKAAS